MAAYATSLSATNASGWTFQWTDGINNNGEIVGYGLNSSGHFDAFALLNVTATPEPLTLLLAVAGLAGLLAYAWRKREVAGR